MMKLQSVFLVVFLGLLPSHIYAGEAEQKKQRMFAAREPVKSLSSVHAGEVTNEHEIRQKMENVLPAKKKALNLTNLSLQVGWHISAHSLKEEEDLPPFYTPENIGSIQAFQDTCFGQMQRLYTEWEETQQLLPNGCGEYEILVRAKHPAARQAAAWLCLARKAQNSRWLMYSTIAETYQLLCEHDTPKKIIDQRLLTLDKFCDLRASLVMATPLQQRSVGLHPLRKSHSSDV